MQFPCDENYLGSALGPLVLGNSQVRLNQTVFVANFLRAAGRKVLSLGLAVRGTSAGFRGCI